jgi:formylglycine-generating enzyme required for sulfatase activity
MIQALEIPGGTFRMGSNSGRPDEFPEHEVRVASFAIGRTPVTNREYARFLEATGAVAPREWGQPGFTSPEQPVVGVSWFDACAYADWLAAATGERWRLPSEAEWERAARGGLEGAPTPWGDSLPSGEVPQGALAGPWPVGRGTPNGFGLFDCGTVVHEWCLDWYRADYYADSPAETPLGPEEGDRRASRGGSWRHLVRWSPPSARSSLPPEFRYADYGFRVLKER